MERERDRDRETERERLNLLFPLPEKVHFFHCILLTLS